MYGHILLIMLANHQIRYQATRKVDCQYGDCRWPLNLPQGFNLCKYVCVNMLTLSPLRVSLQLKIRTVRNPPIRYFLMVHWLDIHHSRLVLCSGKSYYKSSSVCLFVCLSVCLFVPYLLRGPLTDLRQTWWVYVGGPRNCP